MIFREAARFWASLDSYSDDEVGTYLGTIPDGLILQYLQAVLRVDEHFFATLVYPVGHKELTKAEFATNNTEKLVFPDHHWKLPGDDREFDNRTQALVQGMRKCGISQRASLVPYQVEHAELSGHLEQKAILLGMAHLMLHPPKGFITQRKQERAARKARGD